MSIEGLPSGVKPVKFGKPREGEKYINDDGEVVEATFDFSNARRLIVEVVEPSYAERQAAWVKEFDVKVGDRVRVLRAARDNEDGFPCMWNPTMSSFILKLLEVKCIGQLGISDGRFSWPYFVLEKVTPITRPMTRDEFLAAWRERGWCPLVDTCGYIESVDCISSEASDESPVHLKNWKSWQDLANNYRFASDNAAISITE